VEPKINIEFFASRTRIRIFVLVLGMSNRTPEKGYDISGSNSSSKNPLELL